MAMRSAPTHRIGLRPLLAALSLAAASDWAGPAAAGAAGSADELLFMSNRGNSTFELYRMKADGSGVQRVLPDRGESGEMSWSPDGRKVLFTAARGGKQLGVYVTSLVDGKTQLLTDDANASNSPVWSPDGSTIAFVSSRDRSRRIYLMDADGQHQRRLTASNTDDEISPQFSPDGRQVAYVASNATTLAPRVAVADLRSGQSRLISQYDKRAIEAEPRWSPDGSQLLFLLIEGQTTHVIAMAPDGSGRKRMTPADNARNTQPQWSPDGRHILYQSISTETGRLSLHLMKADGSQPRKVYGSANNVMDARWSSDGQRIFFIEQTATGGKVLSTDLAGQDVRRLSGEEGFDLNLQVCCSRLAARMASLP